MKVDRRHAESTEGFTLAIKEDQHARRGAKRALQQVRTTAIADGK